MIKLSTILSLLVFFSASSSLGQAGGFEGNGGDHCENRIKQIRDDLKDWITRGGPNALVLPPPLHVQLYSEKVLAKMKDAKISCTDERVFIRRPNGVEVDKTCRNYVQESSGSLIVECNIGRLMDANENDQYVLVHHEYAGAASFESTNPDGESDYTISNQITDSLEIQVIKKLAVKPRSGRCFIDRISGTYGGQFQSQLNPQEPSFPVNIVILPQPEPAAHESCPILRAYYSRPDLSNGIGAMLGEAKFDPQTMRMEIRHDDVPTSTSQPGSRNLWIVGHWQPKYMTFEMAWWNKFGSVQLKKCAPTEVDSRGVCKY